MFVKAVNPTESGLEIELEHRAGIEPANTGFADQRVSHFATGAHLVTTLKIGSDLRLLASGAGASSWN